MTLTEFLTYASPYVVAIVSVLLTSWRADVRQRQQLAALEAARTSEKLAEVIDEAYLAAENVTSLAIDVVGEHHTFARSNDLPMARPMRDRFDAAVPSLLRSSARLTLFLGTDSKLARSYANLALHANALAQDRRPLGDGPPAYLEDGQRIADALDVWREAAAVALGVARPHRTIAAAADRLIDEKMAPLLLDLPIVYANRPQH